MKQIKKKVYNQFSWLHPEGKHEGKVKEEYLLKESPEVKIDRRKLLSSLLFGGLAVVGIGYVVYDGIEKSKPKIIKDVTSGEILSAYVNEPFDVGKEALEKEGYEIISLEENARLRMQEGYNSDFCKKENLVREAIIYIPNKGVFLTKNSPIMENAKEAIECHRKGIEYYLTNEQVEKALENAVEILSLENAAGMTKIEIPTNRFKDDELTVFAFGNAAKKYGRFLRELNFDKMTVLTLGLQEKPFSRQLYFHGLVDRIIINGDGMVLHCDHNLRGILKNPR